MGGKALPAHIFCAPGALPVASGNGLGCPGCSWGPLSAALCALWTVPGGGVPNSGRSLGDPGCPGTVPGAILGQFWVPRVPPRSDFGLISVSIFVASRAICHLVLATSYLLLATSYRFHLRFANCGLSAFGLRCTARCIVGTSRAQRSMHAFFHQRSLQLPSIVRGQAS